MLRRQGKRGRCRSPRLLFCLVSALSACWAIHAESGGLAETLLCAIECEYDIASGKTGLANQRTDGHFQGIGLMRFAIWAFVGLCVVGCGATGPASEPSQTSEQSKTATDALPGSTLPKASDGKAESLIDQLARPSSQHAWIELRDLGLRAFPSAIEHLQDKRTSFTTDSGSTDETWTVGRACFDVLQCSLEPYNGVVYSSSIPPERYWWRPSYCSRFLREPEKARAWLAAHEGKSLVDLQIEVLDWVTSNRSERKVEVNMEDRESLLNELDTLRRNRKPLKPSIPWVP